MARTMGNYCKAYLLSDLRRYPNWRERAGSARTEPLADGSGAAPRALSDDAVVYVQENYVVTDGVFNDENVLFDAVDPDWIAFCEQDLKFVIPDDVVQAYRQRAGEASA